MASDILQRYVCLWTVGATVAALLPTGARAACEDMYANGAKPTVIMPAPPPLAAANIKMLCRRNQFGVPEFGALNAGYFESAFNVSLGSPSYVAYCLDPLRSGRLTGQFWNTAPNDAAFTSYNPDPDPDVPATVQPTRQFARTSMDLQFGHMAPVASMKQAVDAASQANFLTNGAPMVRALNTGPWKILENYVRTWAQTRAVYVLVGPIYKDLNNVTRMTAGPAGAIGIALPVAFFAIVYQPSPAAGTAPMVLSYQFPNGNEITKRKAPQGPDGPGDLQGWLTPLAAIQTATGFTFPLPGAPGVAAGPDCGNAIH